MAIQAKASIDDGYLTVIEVAERLKVNEETVRVVTRNGKCVYECVWIESDAPGVWFCAYALDLYGWVNLGDVDRFGRRGCVGMYVRADGRHSRKARRATGTPMTTSRTTNSISFRPTARRRLVDSMRIASVRRLCREPFASIDEYYGPR